MRRGLSNRVPRWLGSLRLQTCCNGIMSWQVQLNLTWFFYHNPLDYLVFPISGEAAGQPGSTSQPRSPLQPRDSDMHSLSYTSQFLISSSAYYTRLKKEVDAAGFPDTVTPARAQTLPCLECETVPARVFRFYATVCRSVVPKFKHII